MGVGGQHHSPAALPPGKARYPLYRRLGGSQSRSECFGKEKEFYPLTEQKIIFHSLLYLKSQRIQYRKP
jgi:hypothetical protein